MFKIWCLRLKNWCFRTNLGVKNNKICFEIENCILVLETQFLVFGAPKLVPRMLWNWPLVKILLFWLFETGKNNILLYYLFYYLFLGSDACIGRNGVPLLERNGNFMYLRGMGSFGPVPCHDPTTQGIPGVFANIDNYVPWIKSQLKPWRFPKLPWLCCLFIYIVIKQFMVVIHNKIN